MCESCENKKFALGQNTGVESKLIKKKLIPTLQDPSGRTGIVNKDLFDGVEY